MSDELTRQYGFKADSGLVLPTNTSSLDKRPRGRLRKSETKNSEKKTESSRFKNEFNDHVADIEIKDLLYPPEIDLTAEVHGLLIKFVRKQLGFQHSSIINAATDEVIKAMKDPNLSEDVRRLKIDRLLSSEQRIDDEEYNELINLCKKLNDWDSSHSKITEDAAGEESDASCDGDSTNALDKDNDDLDVDEMSEKAEGEAFQQSKTLIYTKSVFIVGCCCYLFYNLFNYYQIQPRVSLKNHNIQINLDRVDELLKNYPGSLSTKEMRIVRRRIEISGKEVSILMLLGKSKDSHCKLDPTFCVGQTIANVTQTSFGYIDASDPHLHSEQVNRLLEDSLGGGRHSIMIDSLERLPATVVMNLFQFIDKDETHKRRGMLLFVVYAGLDSDARYERLKEADIVERILVEKWSTIVPKDTLTSVISRMCGSIIRVK